jgi:hypothetical protein
MTADEKHGWTPGDASALSHRARAFKLFAEKALGVVSDMPERTIIFLHLTLQRIFYQLRAQMEKRRLAFICTGRSVWQNVRIATLTAMYAISRLTSHASRKLSTVRWTHCAPAQARAPSPASFWAAVRRR